MVLLLYIIPILSNICYISVQNSLSPLLSYLVDNDTSGLINENNKNNWISLVYTSSIFTNIIAYIVHGIISDYFGYKPAYVFMFFMNIIGCILQVINTRSIYFIIIGQCIFGFATTSILSQAWLNLIEDDSNSTKMQLWFSNSYFIGNLLGMILTIVATEILFSKAWIVINCFSIFSSLILLLLLLCVYEPNRNREKKIKFKIGKSFRRENSIRNINTNKIEDNDNSFKVNKLFIYMIGDFFIGLSTSVYASYMSVFLFSSASFSVLYITVIYIVSDVLSFLFALSIVPLILKFNQKRILVSVWIISCIVYFIAGIFNNVYTLICCLIFIYILSQLPFIILRSKEQNMIPESKRASYMTLPVIIYSFGQITGTFASFPISEIYQPMLFYILGGFYFFLFILNLFYVKE